MVPLSHLCFVLTLGLPATVLMKLVGMLLCLVGSPRAVSTPVQTLNLEAARLLDLATLKHHKPRRSPDPKASRLHAAGS